MKIRLVAPLQVPGLDADGRLEVPEGARVRDVLKRLPAAGRLLTVLPVLVNGKQVKPAHILKDGDVLVIVLPISGGGRRTIPEGGSTS